MKKVFLIFFALVVIFGISVIPCFAAGELVGQSNVVTVQLARPKLYYDPSYTSGARLSWGAVGSNGAVTLYYQSHQMYLRDEAAVAYTNTNFTTNSSYGFFELNSFAFDTYKTDGSSWIKFYITETVDGVTVQSNDIYVDVCTKQHIVDTNSDGYDDSSYTAGYNSGSENYKGLILSLSGMTLSWNSYVGGEFDHYMLVITCDTDNYTQPNFIEVDKSLTSYTLSKSDIEDFYQGEVNKLIVSVQAQNASDNTVGDVSNSVTVYYNSTEYSLGYNEGLSEGFLRGQNSAGAGDLTDLVPKILGAVSGFFVSTTGSMTVGGISVLSIISVICLAVLAYLIFKVVNK